MPEVKNVRTFKQLTAKDRVRMETLLDKGYSKREVAEYLHVHRSTIYREYNRGKYMHRNSDYTESEKYSSDLGQKKHDWNNQGKGKQLKIGNDLELAEYIENIIVTEKYSPEAALAKAERSGKQFKTKISVRTLYRYIDSGIFLKLTNKDLPVKGKRKKHPKRVRVQKRASAGESIENRPKEVEDRKTFGHWEMDTVEGKRGKTKSCLLVLTERLTRAEIVMKLPDKKASSVIEALDRLERKWGERFKKVFLSITVDNGTEFSYVQKIERSALGDGKRTSVYYCHPYSSWERGSNENNNRLVRRHKPKGTDLDKVPESEIEYIEEWMNDYPRRILGFRSSRELFEEEVAKLA